MGSNDESDISMDSVSHDGFHWTLIRTAEMQRLLKESHRKGVQLPAGLFHESEVLGDLIASLKLGIKTECETKSVQVSVLSKKDILRNYGIWNVFSIKSQT